MFRVLELEATARLIKLPLRKHLYLMTQSLYPWGGGYITLVRPLGFQNLVQLVVRKRLPYCHRSCLFIVFFNGN